MSNAKSSANALGSKAVIFRSARTSYRSRPFICNNFPLSFSSSPPSSPLSPFPSFPHSVPSPLVTNVSLVTPPLTPDIVFVIVIIVITIVVVVISIDVVAVVVVLVVFFVVIVVVVVVFSSNDHIDGPAFCK